MKLTDLTQYLDILPGGCHRTVSPSEGNPDINGIYYRAQEVRPGGLFVAVRGFSADGHDYISQAIAQGAVAVVCERPPEAGDALILPVGQSRKALADLASAFYGHPSREMTVIGITGTNGKTTTSYLIESVLQAAGMASGVIGTINYRYGGRIFDNPVTTPESLDLQRILADMRAAGVTHVVMEVSSHALDLYRVQSCAIDIGVFTNFSQDHLDYHENMENYWACKRKLFMELLPAFPGEVRQRAVINTEAVKGRELAGEISLPYLTCSQHPGDDIWASAARFDLNGIEARLHTPGGDTWVCSPLSGRHNLENILNAVGVAIALGIPLGTISDGIEALDNVPGRLERIPNDRRRFVYVDYAHTPDALENALLALRALTPDRIITVFGCGGDRDRAKRPQMGAIVARLSDLCVVTSDNPRTEPPEQIIAEIVAGVRQESRAEYASAGLQKGFRGKGYTVVPDRRQAIGLSIRASRKGDTILIAGKGHEPYQIIGSEKRPFDDRQEAAKALGVSD